MFALRVTPKKNRFGSRILAFEDPVRETTPALECPYGLDRYMDTTSVSVALEGDFEDLMRCLDMQISRIFDDTDIVDGPTPTDHRPVVRYRDRGPPLMKVKLAPSTAIVTPRGLGTPTDLVPGCRIVADLYLDHVWIMDEAFGVTWRARRVTLVD